MLTPDRSRLDPRSHLRILRGEPARTSPRVETGEQWPRVGETGSVDDVAFPPGFFDRSDPSDDEAFYSWPRLVTHIDDQAIAAVGSLYDELHVDGTVLDLMSSWVSHFPRTPAHLTILGMNTDELAANRQAEERIVH